MPLLLLLVVLGLIPGARAQNTTMQVAGGGAGPTAPWPAIIIMLVLLLLFLRALGMLDLFVSLVILSFCGVPLLNRLGGQLNDQQGRDGTRTTQSTNLRPTPSPTPSPTQSPGSPTPSPTPQTWSWNRKFKTLQAIVIPWRGSAASSAEGTPDLESKG